MTEPDAAGDCLFCRLAREGDHVARGDGVVAIRDIDPQAPTHLLVIPERHVPSFHEVDALAAHEAKALLDFTSQVAREQGLGDYRVVVNAGEGAGQTVFHLHLHVLGGGKLGRMG